jgi:pyruvate dehydrogenase E1 component beta subunit
MGIDVELIDLRTIRPMDLPTVIESVKKTGRLVTVEEGYPQSSVGTEIATRVQQQAFDYLDAPIITMPARMFRCLTPPISRSSHCRTLREIIDAVKAVPTRRKGGLSDAYQHHNARPVAHHGGGQPRQMAGQGR